MGFKKILCIFVTVLMIFSTSSLAFAKDGAETAKSVVSNSIDEKKAKISRDDARTKAITVLKDYFGIVIDEKKFQTTAELRPDYGMKPSYVWEIRWYMYNSDGGIDIDVSIDATTGKITGVRNYEYKNGNNGNLIPTITQEEARDIAENFIKKINPEEFRQVKYIDNQVPYYYDYRNPNYNFTYRRVINGVEFEGNMISIEVNGITKKVTSYYIRWDDIQFPSAEKVIDSKTAEEIFRKTIKMNLTYIPYRDRYDYTEIPKGIKLVYSPDYSNGYMINAMTGDLMDWSNNPASDNKIRDLTPEEREIFYKKAKTVEKLPKEIDKDRADEVIKSTIKDLYGDDYEIEGLSYQENRDYFWSRNRKLWSAQFYKKDSPNDRGQISIDASTEQLISINLYSFYEEQKDQNFEAKLTWDDAYNKAIDIIAKYFPDKVKNIATEQINIKDKYIVNGKEYPQRYMYFNFPRLIDGIYYRNNNIGINLDAKSGRVGEIRIVWDDTVAFPKAQGIISRDDAMEAFFKINKPKLFYAMINKSQDYTNPDMEIKLCYRLEADPQYYSAGNIDAFTGRIVNYDGQEISKIDNTFKDKIKGSPYEKELKILASQGIIDTKDFDPNREITKMDLVKMLVNARGYRPYAVNQSQDLKFTNIKKDDENYKYLQLAVMYKIIEDNGGEFRDKDKVTREQLAEAMVKLVQYDKLAGAKGIFTLPYTDAKLVSSDKVGYVAIAKGLGIMDGNNGKFRPKDNAKMVELAAAVYHAMGSLRDINY